MGRVSQAAPHLSVEEVKEKLRVTTSYWRRQKWLAIYNALVDPRPAAEIAKHTGISVASVHKLLSQYNRSGAEAIETLGKGGRHNYYLTLEQEQEFLAKFFEAARGQVTTATEIKIAYEKMLGHTVNKTTVYRLLNRHKWRQIVPRPRHIKAEPNRQEEF